MIQPRIKWNSLRIRIERIERAKCSQRYVFVITVPYKRINAERLDRTHERMRDEFGYVPHRDQVVHINKFFRGEEEPTEGPYDLLVHNMVR